MHANSTRRQFLACVASGMPALAGAPSLSFAEEDAKQVETATITEGELKVMVLILMFNKTCTDEDEIRFSLFKFKVPRFPRPAWDFQYVIRKLNKEKKYGFKARLVWKKFVSPDDCLKEYEMWADSTR